MIRAGNLTAITLTLFLLSCQSNKGGYDTLTLPSTVDATQAATFKDINLPEIQLTNGSQFTAQFTKSGCFEYQSEIVTIKKISDYYLLSYCKMHDSNPVPVITDSVMTASYTTKLEVFSNYCKLAILQNRKDTVNQAIFSTTSSMSLLIKNAQQETNIFLPYDGNYNPLDILLKESFLIPDK